MPSIQYGSELDKIKCFYTYSPIVKDLSKHQLEVLILLIINGSDIDYAFDIAMSYPSQVS